MAKSDDRRELTLAGRQAGTQPLGSDPGCSTLDEQFDALWWKVREQGTARLSAADLRADLRELALAARKDGLRAEQFLGRVKASWAALPEVRMAADPLRTRDLLAGIITSCIHEFYRE